MSKKVYFTHQLDLNKNNEKKTLKHTSICFAKRKKESQHLTDAFEENNDPKEIADTFGNFF